MTEKTETKENGAEVAGTRSPLAKVVPIDQGRVDLFNPMRWGPEDIEVIKKTVCPAGIPDAEFKLFILKCQASGMNPLLGEAFCVKRRQNIGSKERPEWVDVFQFTPGEQGMEGRADDFADYRGLRAAAVYENDKIIIDSSAGEVSHQWNPVDPKRGRLIGAWAIAYREGRKTPVEFVRIEEYIDTRNPKWTSSPATMIVKCARAAALRRAYPNRFDGIFVREELPEDGERVIGTPPPAQAEQTGRDTTDALADRLKQTAAAQAALKGDAVRPGAVSVPASQATVDVVAGKPKVQETKDTRVDKQAKEAVQREQQATETMGQALGLDSKGPEFMPEGSKPLESVREREERRADADPSGPAGAARDMGLNKLPHQIADEKKAAAAAQGPLMVFGGDTVKGKPISSFDGPKLLELIALGEAKVGTLPADKAAKVRANLEQIKAVMAQRDKALLDDAPEPGSDLDVD